MARGDMRNQPKAQPAGRRTTSKMERPADASPAADEKLRKRRARPATATAAPTPAAAPPRAPTPRRAAARKPAAGARGRKRAATRKASR